MTSKTKDIIVTILFVIWFILLLAFPDVGREITLGAFGLVLVIILIMGLYGHLET